MVDNAYHKTLSRVKNCSSYHASTASNRVTQNRQLLKKHSSVTYGCATLPHLTYAVYHIKILIIKMTDY